MDEERRRVNWRVVAIVMLVSLVITTAIFVTAWFVLIYETEYHLEGTIISIDQENEHLVIERAEGGIVIIQATEQVLAKATYFQLEGERVTLLVAMHGNNPDVVMEIISFTDGR